MKMENILEYALDHPARSSLVMVSTETMSHEANRLVLHAVTVVVPAEGYCPSAIEVGYALST